MVVGARNFENNDLWYVQARQISNGKIVPNSAIENLLMMDDLQDDLHDGEELLPKLWLESCKCHSNYNALLATRLDPAGFEADVKGRLRGVRPPDYLCVWMNTPQNRGKLGITEKMLMANEHSELYPIAMRECFGVDNEYRPDHTWKEIADWVSGGSAVVASLKIGHSIMFKAFDSGTGELIYVDPYPKNKTRTWMKMRMSRDTHAADIQSFVNIYAPEA